MKKTATALLWAALVTVLPATSIADQDQDRQQTDPTADPCASLLPDDPKGYQDCKDGQLEGIGIACYIYTFNPVSGTIKKTLAKAALGKACPDNGLARAEAQLAAWRAEQAKQSRMQSCKRSGKIWDPVSEICLRCPVGEMNWKGGDKCVPTNCPSYQRYENGDCMPPCEGGQPRDSHGQCRSTSTPPHDPNNPPHCGHGRTWHPGTQKCLVNCAAGKSRNDAGVCVANNGSPINPKPPSWCGPGNLDPACNDDPVPPPKPRPEGGSQPTKPAVAKSCPAGQIANSQGVCVYPPCPSGQTRNSRGVCTAPPPNPIPATGPWCPTFDAQGNRICIF